MKAMNAVANPVRVPSRAERMNHVSDDMADRGRIIHAAVVQNSAA